MDNEYEEKTKNKRNEEYRKIKKNHCYRERKKCQTENTKNK